jgi:hypothetical protein
MDVLRVVPGVAVLVSVLLALAPSTSERTEAIRLRKHFMVVERELLARDLSTLTPAQRAARTEQVRQLRRYAARGEFPRNELLPGQVPFFRDSRGNLCAMAFLIAASGRGDIVDHVARTRNNAYVPDLADEPGLASWLEQHGLTLAEAARIQPTYGDPNPIPDDPPSYRKPATGYVVASLAAGGLSTAAMVLNARSMDRLAGHRARGLLGLGAGAANLALGLAYVGNDGSSRQAFGIVNLGVGAAAMILGARALSAKPQRIANASRLRLSPTVSGGATPRIGFSGNLRF